jgi:cytochrome c biogenesis protein CcmG/thiol:disulfide interchange protein DsbE
MNRLRGILFLAGGLLIGLAIGGVILFSGLRASSGARRVDPPATGAVMADFELEGLNRKKTRLSDLRGKPVVLNFWATWCPPCREEMPVLDRAARELKGKVTFVGVNYAEDVVTVQNYITDQKIDFPIWLDPNGAVSDLLYIDSYPNTFFIDQDGVLRAQHIGQLTEETLNKYLVALGVNP